MENRMKAAAAGAWLRAVTRSLVLLLCAPAALADVRVLVVSGLGGEPRYERDFATQAERIATAAQTATGDPSKVVLLSGASAQRDAVRKALNAMAKSLTRADQAIVVLIGHGTFDGEDYRFNLPGPDLTGNELGQLFDALPATEQLIVNATSASGAVIARWERPRRVLVTATRSGGERNATRFAQYWLEGLTSSAADRDKNEELTAAEAFEFASRKVADSFKTDVALATEHAQLRGLDAERMVIARLGTQARLAANPEMRGLLQQQAGMDRQLEALKTRKATLSTEVYYEELERLLVEVARLDQRIDAKLAATGRSSNESRP
jgi:hypothetical protein